MFDSPVSLANVEASSTGVNLPNGSYVCRFHGYEAKQNAQKGSERLLCRFIVVEGQYAGSSIFEGFNFVNSSQQAVDIAYANTKAWALSVGLSGNEDVGYPLFDALKQYYVGVTVKQGSQGHEFKSFCSVEAARAAGVSAAQPGAPAAPAAAGAGAPPLPTGAPPAAAPAAAPAPAAAAPAAAPAPAPAPAAPAPAPAPVAAAAPAAPPAPPSI